MVRWRKMEETAQGSTHPRSIYLRKCNRFNDIEHCRKQVVGPLRVSERWLNLPRKPEKPRDIEPQPTTQRSKPRPLECYIDKTVHDLRSSSSFHLQCREDNVINLGVQGARPACWCEHFGVAPRRSQHTVVQQAFCSLSKGVTPRIVQENSLYWLVFKPRGWECSALLLDHTGVGVPSCRSKSNITELNLEPDKEILLKHPVLFSKRHNYGVVLHLEKEWSGITIIAKSEESYHQLLDLLENGLIKCQLSFLVERSQQTKISQIEGKTRFGDSRLKINILQCVDLANLNKVPPTYKSPKQPKSSKVCTQSRIFVEIDFPPILMEEIFTANGLRIVQNTDLENAAVNSDASSACCCYCVTLVEPRPGESSHLTSTLRKIRVESQNALFRASNNSTSSGPNKLNIQISDWASQIADCLRRNALMKHYNSRLLYR